MLAPFPRPYAPAKLSGDRRGTLINHILPLLPRATKRDGRWPQKQSQQEKTKNALVGGPHAADLDVELAIPAEYTRATTPKHWRRPDARAGTPPYYVSPIADVPPTEV